MRTVPCSGRAGAARRCGPSGRPVCSPGDGPGAAPVAGRATRIDLGVARRRPRDDLRQRRSTSRRAGRGGAGDGCFTPAHGPFRDYRRGRSTGRPTARSSRPSTTASPCPGGLAVPAARCARCGCGRPPERTAPVVGAARPARRPATVLGCSARLAWSSATSTRCSPRRSPSRPTSSARPSRPRAWPARWRGRDRVRAALVSSPTAGRRVMLVAAAFCAPILCAPAARSPRRSPGSRSPRPSAARSAIVARAARRHGGRRGDAAELPGLRHQPVALSTGLGAGLCVMALPLADLGPAGLAARLRPAAGLPGDRRHLRRRLPESRRFGWPHATSPTLPARRLALLAASGFLVNLLVAPATFFHNRYLKDVRGYSRHPDRPVHAGHQHPRRRSGSWSAGGWPTSHGGRRVGAVAVVGGAGHRGHVLRRRLAAVAGATAARPSSAGPPCPPSASTAPSCSPPAGGAWPPASSRRLAGRLQRRPAGRRRAARPGLGYGPVMRSWRSGRSWWRCWSRPLPRDRPPRRSRSSTPRTGRGRVGDRRVSAGCAAKPATPRRHLGVGALRSWPPPSSQTWVTGPGMVAVAASSSSGVPNGSLVPCTNRHGTSKRRRCSMRSWSGWPGGCSG